jgi:hypothetical protein
MNARTEFQIIVGQDGKPAFVVVPYEQFRRMKGGFTHGTVPDEVVNFAFERGVSAMAAWPRWSGSRVRARQPLKRWLQPSASRWNNCAGRYARLTA